MYAGPCVAMRHDALRELRRVCATRVRSAHSSQNFGMARTLNGWQQPSSSQRCDMENSSDSSSEEEEIIVLLLALRRKKKKKKHRRVWVRPIFSRRRQQGEYHNLLQELRLVDPDSHFRYLRMSKERFDSLLSKVVFLEIS